jgi:hypothetical protein
MDMNMNMTMNMGAQVMPMKMVMTMLTKMTVKSIDSSGAAKIASEVLSQDTSMVMNGKSSKMPGSATKGSATMTMSPEGKVSGVDLKQGASNPMSMMGGTGSAGPLQMAGTLPSKPVSPGSHWSSSGNVMGSGMDMSSTLDKVATVNGHTIAYVTSSGTMDLGKLLGSVGKSKGVSGTGTVGAHVHYGFDVTSGYMLDTTGTMTYNMNMGTSQGSMKMKGTGDMKLNLVQ